MAKDDMFKIIYTILRELYEHMKEGTRVPFCDINAGRFQINEGYWVTIICELAEQGYISGIKIRNTKTGKVVGGVDEINITLKGVEYLQENSTMKKVHEILKGIKDIAPGI